MATHSSILASVPWTEEPGGLQSMGSQRIIHNLAAKQKQHTTPYTKLNLKCIKGLNVRTETIRHLEENISGELFDISLGNFGFFFFFFFLDLTSKAKETTAKVNKWDYIKVKKSSV